MSSDNKMDPTPEQIEKMLEEARMKTVPPQILKGFKDDVMRRIESERRAKPGRWFGSDFKLPRVGLSVGFGALACLIVASLAVFTMEKPATLRSGVSESVPSAGEVVDRAESLAGLPGKAGSGGSERTSFQVASLPAQSLPLAAPAVQSFDKMRVSAAPAADSKTVGARMAAPAAKPAAVKRAKLTVEEELRLIEEFDDQKFFIRQDITEDDLASA